MVERGETGALAAARREPGPAARDAGAEGTVLCRDLPGGHRPRERVGARMPELRCQTVGPWRLPERAAVLHTHLSAHLGGSSAGAALLVRQQLQLLWRRERTVSTCSG